MPISLQTLVEDIEPKKTVLLFGAGASIPSGGPNVSQLITLLSERHKVTGNYSLSELTGIIESRERNRRRMIETLRSRFKGLKPTGGLLNLPRYEWRSLFTTNYDCLIEDAYTRAGVPVTKIVSNFDFTGDETPGVVKLFKLHGTIEKDVSDGFNARLILTEADYDQTQPYRDQLYYRMRADLAGAHLIIIGQSLADPHIRELVNHVARINQEGGGTGKISLLAFEADAERARLQEDRGIRVCFGGIDEFFAALAANGPEHALVYQATGSPLDRAPGLRPITIDVAHAEETGHDVSAMFNGWPATYADIEAGLTFVRNLSEDVASELLDDKLNFAVILGASGLGKTTAARQILHRLRSRGFDAFEHKGDHTLQVKWWLDVASNLKVEGKRAILFVDDAHHHLSEVNALADGLNATANTNLKLLLTSARNHWGPRVKSPSLYRQGREFPVTKLSGTEIDRLLNLVDGSAAFKPLIDAAFSGFSVQERRRRLVDRCESETFVCLKNIFASERFDDIILREYAALNPALQEVYRLVAAMENAGIHVHRQLVIRLLGIAADKVGTVLSQLEEIVAEYTIDDRQAIYGWRGRHPVIVEIIARYKYNDIEKISELFERVIDNISPSYEVEIRSIRELCNLESGIPRIPDKKVQNRLLRKMMSAAPSERVPRHRLVRNLIDMEEFEKAETEIRIFQADFKADGPMARYRLALMTARAEKTPGIMLEDRVAIMEQARSFAASAIARYQNNKNLVSAYCDLGLAYYRLTGKLDVFDEAMAELKAAEVRLSDPEITRSIRYFERKISAQSAPEHLEEDPV